MSNKVQILNVQNIVKLIIFFDLFDHPLTVEEVWQNLDIKCELKDVENILSLTNLQNIKELSAKDGFYFLCGRDEIVQTRSSRIQFAKRKIKKAKKITQLLKFIPWIRMIAIGNLIGKNNLRDGSDIDLFIITDARRIWATRFFCVVIAQILGVRPRKNDTRDKICLSFFVSSESLNLEKLMLPNISKDLYFIYWLAGLLSIYNTRDTYMKFMSANNWLVKDLPNWKAQNIKGLSKNNFLNLHSSYILDFLFGRFESKLKKLQLKIMPKDLKTLMNQDTRVVVSDSILKLHIEDRRLEFCEKYNKKRALILDKENQGKF